MKKTQYLIALLIALAGNLSGQPLQPGFSKNEYREMLRMAAMVVDVKYRGGIPEPQDYKFIYRSPVVGLDNRWDLFVKGNSVAAISLRGTTREQISWLENFYAAMVPAKGQLQLDAHQTFDYALAEHPQAAVHVGWLTGIAFLSRDILPKIDSLYGKGFRAFIVTGHSQGGALSYLLTAHLRGLQRQGKLPKDIVFETYSSAAPKPGNLYFAHAYEADRRGWAFNVVNSADWVPETPITVQTLDDYNKTNPFKGARKALRKQRFPLNLVLTHAFNRLDKPLRRSQRRLERYLGRIMYQQLKGAVPGYQRPEFYSSAYYVRTGETIVLLPDSAYYQKFPDNNNQVFVHHLIAPYLFLLERSFL